MCSVKYTTAPQMSCTFSSGTFLQFLIPLLEIETKYAVENKFIYFYFNTRYNLPALNSTVKICESKH